MQNVLQKFPFIYKFQKYVFGYIHYLYSDKRARFTHAPKQHDYLKKIIILLIQIEFIKKWMYLNIRNEIFFPPVFIQYYLSRKFTSIEIFFHPNWNSNQFFRFARLMYQHSDSLCRKNMRNIFIVQRGKPLADFSRSKGALYLIFTYSP